MHGSNSCSNATSIVSAPLQHVHAIDYLARYFKISPWLPCSILTLPLGLNSSPGLSLNSAREPQTDPSAKSRLVQILSGVCRRTEDQFALVCTGRYAVYAVTGSNIRGNPDATSRLPRQSFTCLALTDMLGQKVRFETHTDAHSPCLLASLLRCAA